MNYYCDCTQDERARTKDSYRTYRALKPTSVDKDGFCTHCDHVAFASRHVPNRGYGVYQFVIGLPESSKRQNSEYVKEEYRGESESAIDNGFL